MASPARAFNACDPLGAVRIDRMPKLHNNALELPLIRKKDYRVLK
jgi:hypothetical protein